MATDILISKQILDWASTKSDEVVLSPMNGFYPFHIVAEAYEKGKEDNEKQSREIVFNEFMTRVAKVNKYILQSLHYIKDNNFTPLQLFLNYDYNHAQALILIDESEHLQDSFIDTIYPLISKIELSSLEETNLNLDISFVDFNPDFDSEAVKSEGFSFGLDLITGDKLF